jgi:hypothetical protein
MNKGELIKRAKTTLEGSPSDAVCVTSDGSVFLVENKSFANAHSLKLEEQNILVVGKTDKFAKDNERLLFKSSKWEFVLADGIEIVEEPTGSKSDLESFNIKELRDMAKELEGYKHALSKAELINLISENL